MRPARRPALRVPLDSSLRGQAPSVCVLIPTLNEAANLPHVLTRIPAEYEVLVVDGSSADGTSEVAARVRPDARIIQQNGHGKGAAVVSGIAAARSDIIVMFDADGSARSEEIPRFVEALLAGADFAKGSRFLGDGGSADMTRVRRAGNRALTGLVNTLFGTRYTDLCYGYNAFWRRCAAELAIDANGFEIETQLNIRACTAGLLVTEVPSFEDGRLFGTSNLRALPDGVRVLRTIVAERLHTSPFAALSRAKRAVEAWRRATIRPGNPVWTRNVNTRAASALGLLLQRTRVSSNALSVAALALALAGAVFVATRGGAVGIWSAAAVAAVLQLAVTLDCLDGQLARARGASTPFGAWLDQTCDFVAHGAVITAVVVYLADALALSPVSAVLVCGAAISTTELQLFASSQRNHILGLTPARRTRILDFAAAGRHLSDWGAFVLVVPLLLPLPRAAAAAVVVFAALAGLTVVGQVYLNWRAQRGLEEGVSDVVGS